MWLSEESRTHSVTWRSRISGSYFWTHNTTKLSHEDKENIVDRPITKTKPESYMYITIYIFFPGSVLLIYILPTKKLSGVDDFTAEFYQTKHEELTDTSQIILNN